MFQSVSRPLPRSGAPSPGQPDHVGAMARGAGSPAHRTAGAPDRASTAARRKQMNCARNMIPLGLWMGRTNGRSATRCADQFRSERWARKSAGPGGRPTARAREGRRGSASEGRGVAIACPSAGTDDVGAMVMVDRTGAGSHPAPGRAAHSQAGPQAARPASLSQQSQARGAQASSITSGRIRPSIDASLATQSCVPQDRVPRSAPHSWCHGHTEPPARASAATVVTCTAISRAPRWWARQESRRTRWRCRVSARSRCPWAAACPCRD